MNDTASAAVRRCRESLRDCVIVEAGPSDAVVVSAEELAKELAADTTATHRKYLEKTMLLTGVLVRRDRSHRPRFTLSIKAARESPQPVFLLVKTEGNVRITGEVSGPDAATTKWLKAGATVTLYGQYYLTLGARNPAPRR